MNAVVSVRPVIGVSACLLGEPVRYDGGHKRYSFITETLSDHFDFVRTCPETAIGMGVPRPAIRLTGDIQRPRVVGVADSSLDVTAKMERFAHDQSRSISHLSGYILKKDSPTCGMQRVKVYGEKNGQMDRKGQGIFARIIMESNPLLPVEEEGRLNDPILRENFINRVCVYHQWLQLQAAGITAARLIGFHSRQKYLVMAHSQAAYKRLGRLLSNLSNVAMAPIGDEYIREVMTALTRRVTPARHINVLQHIMGYLKRNIDAADKAELIAAIEAYRRQEVPLVVPLTLLKHYFRRHDDPYISQQTYLQPHPAALGLRNFL